MIKKIIIDNVQIIYNYSILLIKNILSYMYLLPNILSYPTSLQVSLLQFCVAGSNNKTTRNTSL